MAFNNIKIVGNGIEQVAVTNTATVESVINSLVAYNSTAGELSFSLMLDGVEVVSEKVDANGSFRFVDKLNIPVGNVLTVNAAIGVNVTISYFTQAIDTAAVLSAAQILSQSVSDDADRAEAALGDNSNPIITGSFTEQVAVMPADEIVATNVGTYQTRTGVANTTLTNSLTTGQSALYHFIGFGITYTLTFPAGTKYVGGVVPTLTDDDFVGLWMEGSQLWAEYKGTGVQA